MPREAGAAGKRDVQVARRVLVVDDLAEVRMLVRRALGAHGYQVDGAATLAEARQLDPAGYDALLVDSRLAGESGADLVEALRAQDPAAARRCVIMTGGGAEGLPGGVAYLAKPFRLSDLLAAVSAAASQGRAGPESTAPTPDAPAGTIPAGAIPHSAIPDSAVPAGAGPAARRLLRLIRLLRDHEHSSLADYLHDGPIQELTAAFLGVQLLRQSAVLAADPRLASVETELDSALTALRALMDELGPLTLAGGGLPDIIRRRTAWLLSAPAGVTADLAEPGPAEAGIAADVTDAAEVLLIALHSAAPSAAAHIAVRVLEPPAEVAMTLTPGPADDAVGDPAEAEAVLSELAAALGARLHADLRRGRWEVRLALAEARAAEARAAEPRAAEPRAAGARA